MASVPVNSTNQFHFKNPKPAQNFQPTSEEVPWSTGLCDCFSDCSICFRACCCPSPTFGRISEIIDKGSTSCVTNAVIYALIKYFSGFACLYSFLYRTRMRQQYNLKGSTDADFFVHFCCECCALAQEYRELKNRGFDMSIGWQENVDRQNPGVAMAPVVEGGMSR